MIIITGLDAEVQVRCHSPDLLILPAEKHPRWEPPADLPLALMFAAGAAGRGPRSPNSAWLVPVA